MAAAKIVSFLRSDTPGVIALIGPSGCGKRHAITEAARQAGVVITHHDLAQGAVAWGRLGSQQLTANGLARSVHVISNASEQFLKDFASAKKTQGKIILVADDAGPGMRAGGVPIVRMQAMSSDAMAKKLFQGQLRRPLQLRDTRKATGINCLQESNCAPITQMCPMSAQARTLPSLTRPRASWRTSC